MARNANPGVAPVPRTPRVLRVARVVLEMRGERLLVGRMLAWRLVLAVLKRILPIQRLVGVVRAARPASERLPDDPDRIADVAAMVCRPRLLRSQDNCLERSLVAYRYLSAIGARPELVIGIRRDGGDTVGHAWVTLDGGPVAEAADDMEKFAELISFTAEGVPRSFRGVDSKS